MRSWLALVIALIAVAVPLANKRGGSVPPSCAQTLSALDRLDQVRASGRVAGVRLDAVGTRLARQLDHCR
jgi:hypothetical protein